MAKRKNTNSSVAVCCWCEGVNSCTSSHQVPVSTVAVSHGMASYVKGIKNSPATISRAFLAKRPRYVFFLPYTFVIILVINKSDSHLSVVQFCNHSYDYRPNRTPLSPLTSINSRDFPHVNNTIVILQGSYASDNVDLRIAGGPYIYKGFMIKGRVNILGYSIFAYVKYSDTVREYFGTQYFCQKDKLCCVIFKKGFIFLLKGIACHLLCVANRILLLFTLLMSYCCCLQFLFITCFVGYDVMC